MYRLTMSLRNKFKAFLQASTKTTEVANPSDPMVLKVESARYFTVWWAMKDMPQVLIKDAVTGEVFKAKVKSSETVTNTITLKEPLPKVLNQGSIIKRAPNYEEIRNVLIGDPDVISSYPAICIVPSNHKNDWMTLTGTTEKLSYSILVHVKEDNHENSLISLMRITQDVTDLLMADLHMDIEGRDYPEQYNKTYNSFVESIDYGVSAKNEMLKTARISWFGDEFWWRIYLQQYPEIDVIFND